MSLTSSHETTADDDQGCVNVDTNAAQKDTVHVLRLLVNNTTWSSLLTLSGLVESLIRKFFSVMNQILNINS